MLYSFLPPEIDVSNSADVWLSFPGVFLVCTRH